MKKNLDKMTIKPHISIITVNLNNLEGLQRTMKSVLEQSYSDYEYIIIDGGSKDGSKEYIEKHRDRLAHFVSEPDKGIYNGMNKGIKASQGEYLLFLNSGDLLVHEKILSENSCFLKGKEIIYFNLQVVDTNEVLSRTYPDELTFRYFLHSSLPHPSTFIKAICFNKTSFYDENLKISSDWKFFIEGICKYNLTYLRVDRSLTIHYLDGISSNPINHTLIQKERKMILNKSFPIFLKDYIDYENNLRTLENLRNSRRIRMLLRFNLINKF